MPLVVAATLTWIAGFVDAVGFLFLGRIYTANMSGNSVALGIQWAFGNWSEAIRRLWPVLAYFIGLLFCRLLIDFGARERIRSIASIAFLIEIGLLSPVFLTHASSTATDTGLAFAYIGLLAVAMGIQNGALTHFSSLTIHTGFVTGTLVKCAEEFTKYVTWAFDELRRPGGSLGKTLIHSWEQTPFRIGVWLALIWATYVAGAFCGALGDHTWKLRSLTLPMAGLLIIAGIDMCRPLAACEEQEQAKRSS